MLQLFERSKTQAVELPSLLSLPSAQIKSASCFHFIYIISSSGFPTSSVFHVSIRPSLLPAAPSSIKARPVLSSCIETGTGRWSGTGGSKVMSEEPHRVTVCRGLVCTMWQRDRWRGRWGAKRNRMNHRTLSSSLLTLSTLQILL